MKVNEMISMVTIKLNKDKIAVIDREDYIRVIQYKWRYAEFNILYEEK